MEHEPWTKWRAWQPAWRLLDEKGAAIPHQVLRSEAISDNIPRLLFRQKIDACEQRVVRIDTKGLCAVKKFQRAIYGTAEAIGNDIHTVLTLKQQLMTFSGPQNFSIPQLVLLEDLSDNWTHVVDRYAEAGRCGNLAE